MVFYVKEQTTLLMTGFGPCIKQPVHAMLKTRDGQEFFGSNEMKSCPGETCPRDDLGMVSGEGYCLCKSECSQDFHAEHEACERATAAGADTEGSVMYLTGHHYCCGNCINEMKKVGVSKVIYLDIGKEEEL